MPNRHKRPTSHCGRSQTAAARTAPLPAKQHTHSCQQL